MYTLAFRLTCDSQALETCPRLRITSMNEQVAKSQIVFILLIVLDVSNLFQSILTSLLTLFFKVHPPYLFSLVYTVVMIYIVAYFLVQIWLCFCNKN